MMARILRSLAVVALVVTACTGAGARSVERTSAPDRPTSSPDPVPIKVAYLQDPSIPDNLEVIAPAKLAIRLAVRDAVGQGALPEGSDVVAIDVSADPVDALARAQELAHDPEIVAAVVAPLTRAPAGVLDVLLDARIPVLSLSGLGTAPPARPWLRLVASLERELEVVARRLSGPEKDVCLLGGEPTAFSANAMPRLQRRLVRRWAVEVTAFEERDNDVTGIIGARCRVAVWSGSTSGAASLRTSLDRAGLPGVPLMLLDPARTVSYLEATVSSEGRTAAFCTCVDISTSAKPAAVTLLHRFQAEFGIGLGQFGAEGWDAGSLIVEAAAREPSRESVAAVIVALRSFRGLAGTYRFDARGERSPAPVYTYRATGARWLLVRRTHG